jgi:hypothetical protein
LTYLLEYKKIRKEGGLMERKLKLAKLILLESEGLQSNETAFKDKLTLAEELTKDAIELAKLVEQEEREIA